MAHGLASALSDRQTDVFPLTQSCTSEMAAWLAVANFKCELSFLGAILAHIEGRLNFILFTCCPPTETHANGEHDRVATNLPGLIRK